MIFIILRFFKPTLLFQFDPKDILSFASNPFQSVLKTLPFHVNEKVTLLRFFSLQRFGFDKVWHLRFTSSQTGYVFMVWLPS